MVDHLYLFNYFPTYFISFFFGVLPFKCDNTFLFVEQNNAGDAFSYSFTGKLFVYVFLGINFCTILFGIRITIEAIGTYNSCFDEVCDINLCRNVCAHFTIFWMNTIADLASSLTILFIRTKGTLDCVNNINRVMRMRIHKEKFYPSAWSTIFFMGVHCTTFFLYWKNAEFSTEFIAHYLPLYLTQCLPIVTENMISVLLLITQNFYVDMNDQITDMLDNRYFIYNNAMSTTNHLIHLKKYYWEATDLAEKVSECFGIDFFFAGICSTIRFIYFLFLTLKYMGDQKVINESGGLVLPSYQSVVFCVAVVGKFCYLCYRCDAVVAEARSIIPNLHTLQNKFRTMLDDKHEQQVEEFLDYVNCREINFGACGFFTLNLHLIRKVFGLTITYFIVLMQFQASHQT